MSASHSELEHILGDLLPRVIEDCDRLTKLERLSGGASQETYRITIASSGAERLLAMRRAAGGEEGEITAQHPGLAVEALLMQVARAQGVPEPEVNYVLQPQDGIGAGFVMQWLEGEALGALPWRFEQADPPMEPVLDNRLKCNRECGGSTIHEGASQVVRTPDFSAGWRPATILLAGGLDPTARMSQVHGTTYRHDLP